jgi:hypothetical protein
MIQCCKYCLYQRHTCPRCEGPVLTRTINEFYNGENHSCSLILCIDPMCSNYGQFKVQTQEAIDELSDFICPDCVRKIEQGEIPIT